MVSDEVGGFHVQAPSIVLDSEIRKDSMGGGFGVGAEDEAWMKYIIEFHLPPDLENIMLMYTRPLVNLAPKSNLKRGEIIMYLVDYDVIWDEYFIYMRKGKYDPNLLVFKTIIRSAFKLQLSRAIGGWLGKLMHTKMFNIVQNSDRSNVQKGVGFFRRKPRRGEEEE